MVRAQCSHHCTRCRQWSPGQVWPPWSRFDGATTPDMMLVMRLQQAAAQHRCESEPALQQGTGYASFGSHDRHDDEAHENDQEAQWWGS